jgi:hypothetical protein
LYAWAKVYFSSVDYKGFAKIDKAGIEIMAKIYYPFREFEVSIICLKMNWLDYLDSLPN